MKSGCSDYPVKEIIGKGKMFRYLVVRNFYQGR